MVHDGGRFLTKEVEDTEANQEMTRMKFETFCKILTAFGHLAFAISI